MKNLALSILFASGLLLTIVSCKKENTLLGCSATLTAYSNAVTAYANDPNAETCQGYVNALTDYINSCTLGQAYKDELEEIQDDCDQYN